jgi:hypothetical protein
MVDMMKLFLKMGDLTDGNEPLSKKVAYKERIVFATMRAGIPGWEKPGDWDNLTDELKMERLTRLEAV